MSKSIILNGEFTEEQEALVSPLNRGLMYGDGCFETLRSYSGRFLHWEDHFNRLMKGMEYLGFSSSFDTGRLREWMVSLLKRNGLYESDASVRIQCWREGSRGYATASGNYSWMAQVEHYQPEGKAIKLITAKTRCIPAESLNRSVKLSNGLNYIQAANEAREQQADDALMLTIGDYVSETTIANIFWIKDGEAFTPSEECDLLPGITRSIVLEILKKLGVKIHTGEFSLQHLKEAEAAFCCNSLRELQLINKLDEVNFKLHHAVVERLTTAFEDYKLEHLPG